MAQRSPSFTGGVEAASSWSFHPDHQAAVDRRRRIIVQYDPGRMGSPEIDVHEWNKYGYQYFDQPNSQVDAIWWDYDPWDPISNRLPAETEVDSLAVALEETHRRGFEAFWHHRISEVDSGPDGLAMDRLIPIKEQHPDWLIKTWWWQGMWNLDVPEVRDFKVELLRQTAERYDFDGYQIDFHRHLPVLPIGRQWELRDSVTDLMRRVREMLLEVSAARNRPILLSAKVPRSLEDCRVDGFDVVRWVQEGLVDMLSVGSRSYEVDIEGYRAALGPAVKLYPSLDDHHTSDAYQYAPLEVFRGVARSWWRQGADGIVTFNWSGGPAPKSSAAGGSKPGPESQKTGYREIGSVEALKGKSKVFPVERRGGYPWAEGASGHNLHAQLPLKLAYDGRPSGVTVYCAEDLSEVPKGKRDVSLRITVFDSEPGDRLEVKLNGKLMGEGVFDHDWKDRKIFSPLPQPNSGTGYSRREVDPEQKLLLVTFDLDPDEVRLGDNTASISVTHQAAHILRQLQVEKVELHVTYGG